MADLNGKQTARFERYVGLGNKAAVNIQPKIAGEKGLRRLVIADFWMEFGGVAFGNIGRIADDGIEGSGLVYLRQASEQVGQQQVDAAG